MKTTRSLALICLFVAGAAGLRAQSLFLAEYHGQMLPVHAVDGTIPEVKVHGKLKHATYSQRLGMKKFPEFGDGFAKIEDKNFLLYNGDLNNELRLAAIIRSNRDFKDCYFVVVFERHGDAGKAMLAAEIPDLDANQKIQFRCSLAITEQMTHLPYFLHLFSGEREIMTSDLSNGFVMDRRARNDSGMLAETSQARPMLIYKLAPRRPDELPDDASGSCLIRFTIGTGGQATNIEVLSATQPEVSQSATDALEQWVFRPAIEDHHFVPTTIKYPFTFGPRSSQGG
jgi:TonB family protein